MVPLAALTSSEQQETLKNQIRKATEYITGIRCEIERRKLTAEDAQGNKVRIVELACYFSLCELETAHKFLTLKNAMNACYKIENFQTAAHFARVIIDMESTGIFGGKPEMLNQFKRYYDAFSKKGTNAHKLAFNPQDSVSVKGLSQSGYLDAGSLCRNEDDRPNATVKCPLTGAVYAKANEGKRCETCQLTTLGKDTMGLNVMLDLPQAKEEAKSAATGDFLF